MSLRDRLTQDLKDALRQKDERRKTTVRLVKAAIKNAEVEQGHPLNDEEILEIVAREVKRRREAIAEFAKGGRQDLIEQEEAELSLLLAYLPPQMSREEIEKVARQAIQEVGATSPAQMGQVMRHLMPGLKGKADGRLVNQVVKEILAEES
jgi:uncharacterized protein YqeY